MPELPEVETVRRGLEPAVVGAVIEKVVLKRKDLRVPFTQHFARRVQQAEVTAIKRRAKYLIFELSNGEAILSHLGMSGRFVIWPDSLPKAGKHDHVIIHFSDGRFLVYHDPRRFGVMLVVRQVDIESHPLLCSLGPEPLEKGFTARALRDGLLARKTPIKQALMDPELVVGVGNIYASEALFLAGIDPRRPAFEVADQSAAIVRAIRRVLSDAIASGGSSLRDFLQVSGEEGYFQHSFNVYGRSGKPCFSCGGKVQSTRQAGRSTFYCPACQK
jgi:formamidopyrimidine-DNA glycosylase